MILMILSASFALSRGVFPVAVTSNRSVCALYETDGCSPNVKSACSIAASTRAVSPIAGTIVLDVGPPPV